MNGTADEATLMDQHAGATAIEGLRPAPVPSRHHSSSHRDREKGEHRERRQHAQAHDQQQQQPLFDIKQHPAAVAYAAAHPNRTIPKFGPYILLQTLGEGEFGKVKLGLHSVWAEEVAVKLIRRGNLEGDVRMQKIRREIAVLESLHHPNIVRLYETIETDKYIGIILDYASGGELFDHILAHRYLREKDAKKLFAQLVSAVWYIHQKKIVHRDLKLENLLLDKNRNIIVTDFGFANRFEHKTDDLMQTSCGSPCYAAPELVVSEGMYVGSAVDIWSCGVILYAMLAGYLPFDDDPENPEGDNIQQLYRYILNTPLTFPEHVSPEARELLQLMLVPDPSRRATLDVVMAHHWLEPYHSLFEKNVEDMERESKELIEAKKWGYRKMMREREKEALRQREREKQERMMKHQTHQVEPSTSSRDARAQFDQAPGPSESRRRAVASAIVLSSSAADEERADHDPYSLAPNGDQRDRKTSTRSSKKGRSPTAEGAPNGINGTIPIIVPTTSPVAPPSQGQPTAGKRKADAFRHTIQVEYDDGTEAPNPPTPPRPSSRSQRQSALEVDVSNLDLNSRAKGEGFEKSPVQQSPSRQSRRSSTTQRPSVPIPAVPALPAGVTSPTNYGVSPVNGRRGSASAGTSSPVLVRNAATDPGPGYWGAGETSESSAAVTPLNSPPAGEPFVAGSSPAMVQSPIETHAHGVVTGSTPEKGVGKKESQDVKRPASAGGKRHTRGISIDRIVGFGKMITGQSKESKDPLAASERAAREEEKKEEKKKKRSSSRIGRKEKEPPIPTPPPATTSAVPLGAELDLVRTNEETTTTINKPLPASVPMTDVIDFPASSSGAPSSSSMAPSTSTTANDISHSESTSGSVKSKRRGGKALSLMVDPISKMKEHKSKNRVSAQVGSTRREEEEEKKEKKDRKAKGISTPLSAHSEKVAPPFNSADALSQVQEKKEHEKAGWSLPLFKGASQRGTLRAHAPPVQAPVPVPMPMPETFGPASGGSRTVPTAATNKSQGVMDWFRKKSLAKERRRAGSSAEPPIMPIPPVPVDESFMEVIERERERAKTPTQADLEEARTPTRATFHTKSTTSAGAREGKTPSVIITAVAGEPSSSAGSHHESVGGSSHGSGGQSRMDRVVGAIKNVTSPTGTVPLPGHRSGKGASSGGSVGGSSSGGHSYSKVVLRLHDGPVDPSTLSSSPPQEIVVRVLEVLRALGIEYTKESEFKYRCVRPKKKRTLREASGSGTVGHAAGQAVTGLDKRGLPMPSSNAFATAPGNVFKYIMRRSSSQAPSRPDMGITSPLSFEEDAIDLGTPAHELPSSENANNGHPKVEPIYGDKPDQHDEVRFSVEVTRIDRLDDLLSLDIRRLKGSLKSYKFLYDVIRERCNLQR